MRAQKSEMQIVPCDLSTLDEATIRKLIDHDREVFGYQGFGEYAACTEPACRRVLSIDEVFGVADTPERYVPLEELEADGMVTPPCPDCAAPTFTIFHPNAFIPYFQELFKNAYGALLLDKNGNIQGWAAAYKAPLKHSFEDLNYKQTFQWETYLSTIRSKFGDDINELSEVIALSRISIRRDYRGSGYFAPLLQSTLNQHPEHDELPFIAVTRYDSRFWPLAHSMGAHDIVTDPTGTVAIALPVTSIIRHATCLSPNDFSNQHGKALVDARSTQKVLPTDKKPRSYPHLPILENIQYAVHPYRLETYSPETLTPEFIHELSDRFRFVFCNEFEQYLFYPSEGEPISPQTVFGHSEHVPLKDLDEFDLSTLPHPQTGEFPKFWHGPEACLNNFRKKLKHGNVAVARNLQTKEIEGFCITYHAPFELAFNSEEWGNPLAYSGFSNSSLTRDINESLLAINEKLLVEGFPKIEAQTEIFVLNGIATLPSIRSNGYAIQLFRKCLKNLPKNKRHGLMMLETMPGSKAHQLCLSGGLFDIPNVLGNETVMMAGSLSKFIDVFSNHQT